MGLCFYLGTLIVLWIAVWVLVRVLLHKKNTFKVPNSEPGVEECILITGCDSGIGRNTAIEFCSMGYTVFATCLFEQVNNFNYTLLMKI